MFGNNVNKSKFYSGRNYEQAEVRECVLLFGAESSVIQVAAQKFKDQDIQGVPGGMCQTSGGCSLCETIPI